MDNYTNERLLKMAALVAHAPSISDRMNRPKAPRQTTSTPGHNVKLQPVKRTGLNAVRTTPGVPEASWEKRRQHAALSPSELMRKSSSSLYPTEDMLRPTMVERLGGPGNGQSFSAAMEQPSAAYAKQPYAGWEGRISPSSKAYMMQQVNKPVPQASWEKRRQHAALSDSEVAANYKRRLGKLVGGVASGVGNMLVGDLGGTAGSVALMLRDMARK